MKKLRLSILGLSYSISQIGSYIIVLTNDEGDTKLPIIIKASEGQRIALESEGIRVSRPMLCDVLKNMTDEYGISIEEVIIYGLAEGIFYTKIITHSQNGAYVEFECSVSDAMLISVIFNCPIYTTEEILESSGVYADVPKKSQRKIVKGSGMVSIEDLEILLKKAIENEEYEVASEIRDRIAELKANGT